MLARSFSTNFKISQNTYLTSLTDLVYSFAYYAPIEI